MDCMGGFMLKFFEGKNIFITGHTGFKGTWLCKILLYAGANVTGYSLFDTKNNEFYDSMNFDGEIKSFIGDVRDYNSMKLAFDKASPEIAIHLAAQPLVRYSYEEPLETYDVNVMGTANFLECVRNSKTVKSVLNVTTDKVYENKEWLRGYKETDILNGFDPYSNSKSCSELITDSYKKSFLNKKKIAVSTARAGNVIGGGDVSMDRIIPDCIRALLGKYNIVVRNKNSIRPYQHVLEPLFAYLLICKMQYFNFSISDNYNVGPNDDDCVTTGNLVQKFCELANDKISWNSESEDGPHEANFLKLDCSKIKNKFGWEPSWHIEEAIDYTIEFAKVYQNNGDIQMCMIKQIKEFCQRVRSTNE